MSKREQERISGEQPADASPDAPLQRAVVPEQEEQGRRETRERILNAAQGLFATHGFSACTTKAIAQRAEVPIGLVFYYFPSKKALLECVINEHNMLSELRAIVTTLDLADPRSALIALGCQYLTTLQRHANLAAIHLREFRSHSIVAEQFRALRAEHIELISSFLEKVLQTGQYEPLPDMQVRAQLFLYGLLESAVIEDIAEPLHFVERMTDVLLYGAVRMCENDTEM